MSSTQDNDNTYVIERFEDNGWAVLERPDGELFNVPQEWMPEGASEGDILRLSVGSSPDLITNTIQFTVDQEETERRLEAAQSRRASWRKGPSGDIEL